MSDNTISLDIYEFKIPEIGYLDLFHLFSKYPYWENGLVFTQCPSSYSGSDSNCTNFGRQFTELGIWSKQNILQNLALVWGTYRCKWAFNYLKFTVPNNVDVALILDQFPIRWMWNWFWIWEAFRFRSTSKHIDFKGIHCLSDIDIWGSTNIYH